VEFRFENRLFLLIFEIPKLLKPMLQTSQYWYLHDHPLFDTLSSQDLKEICYISKYKTARKGEIIFFSEENQDRVFTLKKGSIKIVKVDEEGNELVKDILKKGDMFGQLALSHNSEDEYAVVISESVVFCSFKSSDFEKFIQQNPDLALKYTKWIGFWFRRLENRFSNIMFKDVRSRLLHFFYDFAKDQVIDENGIVVLPNYLTHQDISSLICSTRQTVTSLLNTLKNEEMIDYSRKEMSVNLPKIKASLKIK
jgi:CRP/FNR family transcriptional regulator, cyclic AMP receptor protein